MRKSTRVLVSIVTATVVLISLSGCHGGGGEYKLRFVNQADSHKVVEFTLQSPSILTRVHMAVFQLRIKGTYALKTAETTVDGKVSQDEKGYILTSQDGKKQRFDVKEPGVLKDEEGTLWKLDNPTTAVKLREW